MTEPHFNVGSLPAFEDKIICDIYNLGALLLIGEDVTDLGSRMQMQE
jgi:hypothetical protein